MLPEYTFEDLAQPTGLDISACDYCVPKGQVVTSDYAFSDQVIEASDLAALNSAESSNDGRIQLSIFDVKTRLI